MKTIIIALLITASAQFLPGAEKVENYGFKDVEFVQMEGYNLEFVTAVSDKDHWRMGMFKFRWNGKSLLRLWGFGFQKDGSFRVRFEKFSKLIGEKWEEVPVLYCGTGAEMYELKPDTDYVLKVPLWPSHKGGTKGVVKIGGEKIYLISKPFDVAQLKEG
jgi:hypothetical protein